MNYNILKQIDSVIQHEVLFDLFEVVVVLLLGVLSFVLAELELLNHVLHVLLHLVEARYVPLFGIAHLLHVIHDGFLGGLGHIVVVEANCNLLFDLVVVHLVGEVGQ